MNSKREELALIGSEFWMFGISLFAVSLNRSIHLVKYLKARLIDHV